MSIGSNLDHQGALPSENFWALTWSKFAGPETFLKLSATLISDAEMAVVAKELIGQLSIEQRKVWEDLNQRASLARQCEWLQARSLEAEIKMALGPECLRSFSHTQKGQESLVLAVGVKPEEARPIKKVGVDLEKRDRKVSDRAADRILRSSERKWIDQGHLDALDFWVLKEAAFKATPSNSGSVITELELTDWDVAQKEGTLRSSLLDRQSLSCRVKLLTESGLKVAFAIASESLR